MRSNQLSYASDWNRKHYIIKIRKVNTIFSVPGEKLFILQRRGHIFQLQPDGKRILLTAKLGVMDLIR